MLAQTIVIVDDEPTIRDLLEIVLQRAGYATFAATDGLEGLTMILKYRPSLVILDDDMPLMRGRDLCRNLKNDPQLRAIPIIMHSSHIHSETGFYEDYACADALMPKPSVPRAILDKVKRALKE